MRTRPLIKTLAIASATTLALGLTAAPSQAARTVVTTEEQPWTLFYDNVVTGDGANTLILYTGASVGEECAGDLPTVKVRSRAKGEEGAAGATLVERFVTRATFNVYEGNGLDAVEFFGQVCASLSTGGEAPTPIATGRGLVKRRVDVAYNGAAGAQRAQPRQQHVAALSRDHARRSRYVRRGASARILACYVPAMSCS